jgi:quercetin dioxygenase-like cupin family protein
MPESRRRQHRSHTPASGDRLEDEQLPALPDDEPPNAINDEYFPGFPDDDAPGQPSTQPDFPPELPESDRNTDSSQDDSPEEAQLMTSLPASRPRSRAQRKPRTPIDYSQLDDLDLPIAKRRSKRPKTSPVKFWKGEKIVYKFDESGCWTQEEVVKVHSKKSAPRKKGTVTKEEGERSIDVLEKRNEPGEDGDAYVRFLGLQNRVVRSNEFFIKPAQSMVFTATKERIVLNLYEGKARLSSKNQKWAVSAGGMIYIGRGDTCKLKNKSTDRTVRLFQLNI